MVRMSNATPRKPFDVHSLRKQFPALSQRVGNRRAAYLDGPGGSQTPEPVLGAIRDYLVRMNANHSGLFQSSRLSDELLDQAHRGLADFLGAEDPNTIVFGANMTSLTFAISRALAGAWAPGDEVLVTRLDHDANVTPWVLAARDAGCTVRHVGFHAEDCTLDMDDLASKLSPRTRLVAVGLASNATGTINPVKRIAALARQVGALTYVDAVHYAPHGLIDVAELGCDFLACSAYKFFGPHVGVLWGRSELLRELPVYKLRPAPDSIPGRWMTGTQNHEGIAGALAAVDYLADLGRSQTPHRASRRDALRSAYQGIAAHEGELLAELLAGLDGLKSVKIWGITDPARFHHRVPTVSITHAKRKPAELAQYLGERGLYVWHGNYYALSLTEALGLEPAGMVRIGLLHYNTHEEVDRLLEALAE